MSFTIEIPVEYHNPKCPDYWKNFVDDIKYRIYNDLYSYVPTGRIAFELRCFDAHYKEYVDKNKITIGEIIFKNAEAASFFILKWS